MVSGEVLDEPSLSRAQISWFDAGIFLLAAVGMCWGLGGYGLYEPHEAQYAGAAGEMLLRGDLVTPYLNGRPNSTNRPFFIG